MLTDAKAKEVPCPLCNSDQNRLLYLKNNYRIVCCSRCKFIYVNPRPKEKETLDFYNINYFLSNSDSYGYKNYFEIEENEVKNAEKKIKTIERYKKSGNLLDVGCAAGFFLDVAQKRGWKVIGVELSKDISDFAKEKFKLDIKNCSLLQANFPPTSFDVVVLWDVLEHLPDINAVMLEIKRILKNQGLLALSTPNIESLASKQNRETWIQIKPPEHLNYFSKNTSYLLVEKYGFEILKLHYGACRIFQHKINKMKSKKFIGRTYLKHRKYLFPIKNIFFSPLEMTNKILSTLGKGEAIFLYCKKKHKAKPD